MARILIVDDDESIRRLVRLNLADLYEIFDTGKPEEALALALEHKPDAILLDLRMPGYSGFELCKTFTSFSATQLIPVFVISGEGGSKTKEFCRDLGAAAYFEKPVNFDALRASLVEALQKRRSGTTQRSAGRTAGAHENQWEGLEWQCVQSADHQRKRKQERVSLCLLGSVGGGLNRGCVFAGRGAGARGQSAGGASGVARDAISALWIQVHGDSSAVGCCSRACRMGQPRWRMTAGVETGFGWKWSNHKECSRRSFRCQISTRARVKEE